MTKRKSKPSPEFIKRATDEKRNANRTLSEFRVKAVGEIALTARALKRGLIPLSALLEIIAGEAFQEVWKTAPIESLREAEIEYVNGLRAALINAKQSILNGSLIARELITLMPINGDSRIQMWCRGNGSLEELQYWRPVVKIENARDWLSDLGVPVPSWLAAPSRAGAFSPKEEAPEPRGLIQEKCILKIITELGHDPKALPKPRPGRPGVKSTVRNAALNDSKNFTRDSFLHTWKRLLSSSEIVYRHR